jgi:hypothetical protein
MENKNAAGKPHAAQVDTINKQEKTCDKVSTKQPGKAGLADVDLGHRVSFHTF